MFRSALRACSYLALSASALVGLVLVAYRLDAPEVIRGDPAVEFDPGERRGLRPKRERRLVPWPTFGYDISRTKVGAGFGHRPPYREQWQFDSGDTVEFPPSVGYGKVFLAQQKGRFYALDARSGRLMWQKRFGRCSASSPTLANGVVYQTWMGSIPCTQARYDEADGFLAAWRARDGRELWRFTVKPIESSPLYHRGTIYIGSWDRSIYALRARDGHIRWRFEADGQLNSSPAYYRGAVLIASKSGSLYSLDANTGRLRWRARSDRRLGRREEFYASPVAAYGRVYVGNVDGTFHAYGARTGRLLWQRPLGTYIYSSAAVWRGRVYVGTYNGELLALDAATGEVVWRREAAAAVHSAPVVINGVIYYASCSTCGQRAVRGVKQGHDGTYALDAVTGRELWRFRAGKYASPIVADQRRVYIVGRAKLFALTGSDR